ncbi:MAG: regulatory protein RecX [Phycisphaerales bacterium]
MPRPRPPTRKPPRQRPDAAELAESLLGAEITSLTRGVRDPSRVSVRSDRRLLCTIDEVTVVRLKLRKGQVIDEALAAQLARSSELDRLRAAALRRVARSMCSGRQLAQSLQRRGASKADAAELVADFQRLGLIDDAAFAEAKARALAASGKSGPRLIEAKLRTAGIAPDLARAAATRIAGLRDADEDARAFAQRRAESLRRRKDTTPETAKRRLFAALVRRGFDTATSKRAVEHALGRGR